MFLRLVPFLFALLWSTGFVGAKYGLPYIEPFSFLAARFLIVLVLLGAIIIMVRPPFPRHSKAYADVFVAGVLIHGIYLGGVFTSIKLGLPAGVAAVIVGVQPVLTVLLVYRLKSPLTILIAIMGFVGLLLVLYNGENISDVETALAFNGQSNMINYLPAVIALFAITLGTLYQKKHCADVHILSSAFLQYIPTCLLFLAAVFFFESDQVSTIVWHSELIFALLWLVVVLSVGAVLLMNVLYQHNSANIAASYFYLSPPFALILAYFFFDETISLINFLGIILIVVSIYTTAKLQKIS